MRDDNDLRDVFSEFQSLGPRYLMEKLWVEVWQVKKKSPDILDVIEQEWVSDDNTNKLWNVSGMSCLKFTNLNINRQVCRALKEEMDKSLNLLNSADGVFHW